MQSHPGVTSTVRTGSGEEILHRVANGEVDIGLCLRRKTPPGVEVVRAFPQRLGLVTSREHALTRLGRAVRLRDCLDHPLIEDRIPDSQKRRARCDHGHAEMDRTGRRGCAALHPLVSAIRPNHDGGDGPVPGVPRSGV